MNANAVRELPAHPVLEWSDLYGRKPVAGSVLDGRDWLLLASGRVALAHALRMVGARAGDEVLLPAYHCLAMVTPLQWMGVRPVFYPLTPDLRPDYDHLPALINNRTRALVVVHFFGWAQRLSEVRAQCDRHGIALIEDCAHAFYTQQDEQPVGGVGEYAICSPMKFLPMFDGGALIAGAHVKLPALQLHSVGWRYQLKSLVDVLERAATLDKLPGLNLPIRAARFVKQRLRLRAEVAVPAAVTGGFDFDPRWMEVHAARLSRYLLVGAERRRVVPRRLAVFAQLSERLAALEHVELPFQPLVTGTVPYVLPILADDGEALFWRARHAGIQVFRWEFTESQSCPVTRRYARGLLQFPCHQGMTQVDVDRVVNVIEQAAKS